MIAVRIKGDTGVPQVSAGLSNAGISKGERKVVAVQALKPGKMSTRLR